MDLPAFPDGYALDTARLALRAPSPGDMPVLWPLVSDHRLTPFLAWEAHGTPDETTAMIDALMQAQREGRGFHWLVRSHDDAAVQGLVSLIDVRRTHRALTWQRAELAYWTAPDAQGRGIASEAARAVMRCGFGALGLHKIVVYHAVDNPPSGRVVEKLGFRLVGTEREAFRKQGRWHDLRQYELLASEFEDRPTP